jgi:hypothetical protein
MRSIERLMAGDYGEWKREAALALLEIASADAARLHAKQCVVGADLRDPKVRLLEPAGPGLVDRSRLLSHRSSPASREPPVPGHASTGWTTFPIRFIVSNRSQRRPASGDLMNPTNRDGIFDGLCVMDVDTHISEPHDLWTENAPVSVRDRLPRVKEIDGAKHWIVDGDINLGTATPVSVVHHDGNKSNGIEFFNWSMEEVHAASYDMEARVRLMDDLGLRGIVMFSDPHSVGLPDLCDPAWHSFSDVCG